MYLYQATKFASQLKSVTHSAAAFEPLFRSYRIWRYLWFNYWTEARQNGGYWLNLRSPNMVDSVMQFLSQKSWEGLARTASVSAHAETDITCLLITNHRHFRFCARRDGNHLLVDHYQYHYRFCARKNGSRLVTNHRSQSRDEWSPYCLRNSTLTSCAYTQLAIFGNKIFGMVSSIPGSSMLGNFFHCQIGSTLEKQFSPLSQWEILLWALIPHQKTPDHSIRFAYKQKRVNR